VRASGFRCPVCRFMESEVLHMTNDGFYMELKCDNCGSVYFTIYGEEIGTLQPTPRQD
jgi:uncharacterized Zn finger protein